MVQMMGGLTGHRPFQGATSLGTSGLGIGLDVGLEASLVHFPEGFGDALTAMGANGSALDDLPSFPMAKLHVHKSLGTRFDLGASGVIYRETINVGANIKYLLFAPEEGLHWALRGSYTYSNVDLESLGFGTIPVGDPVVANGELVIRSQTVSADLLVSKRLHFAEPYLGVGADWITGHMEVPITFTAGGSTQTLVTSAYSFYAFHAFLGVAFRVPAAGLKIGIEGAYSSIGMHYLGAMLGAGW